MEAATNTQNIERKPPMTTPCVSVSCSCFLIARQKILYLSALRDGESGWAGACSRFLIARQKISCLSALRDGKEGGRVEAATHTQNISRKTMPDCDLRVCVCVCVCVTCSRFLIARQKISCLSALRDGKEGGRVEAATHTQNISRKTMPDCDLRACVCVCDLQPLFNC